MDSIYKLRLEKVRSLMRARGLDAVIITGTDPHQSEYPAARWKQVEWVSGFTGEAGDILITADHAGLWTDSRYFIQAREQLAGTGFVLHKTRVPDEVPIPKWIAAHFSDQEEVVIGVDGLCISAEQVQELNGNNYRIVDIPDMLDALWQDRPAIPETPVTVVSAAYSGETRAERLLQIREFLEQEGCDSMLVTALDEIAWTLNVRGSDIDYNPYVISYLLVSADEARWFVLKDVARTLDPVTLDSLSELESDGVQVLPYSDLELSLEAEAVGRLVTDGRALNYHLHCLLEQNGVETVLRRSPIALMKAVKNSVEIRGMEEAHIIDGVAMERFLYWLESSLEAGRTVSEWDAALELGRLRSENPHYRGDSFETISAYGPGAALPHYITPRTDAPLLERRGLYLCDSGGQYDFGTTDITRTVPLGECTQREREDYTLVLKGHINLAMAVFPEGTPGCRLDALAREPLWRFKRNFGHGTGHGVGFFLGVHEGPQDIRQNLNAQPLEPGMITSDEPGIYIEGRYGIRHENLLLCERDGENDFGSWLKFRPLTLCHFDTSILIRDLLTAEERAWLSAYHERVCRELTPLLPSDVAEWLLRKTQS